MKDVCIYGVCLVPSVCACNMRLCEERLHTITSLVCNHFLAWNTNILSILLFSINSTVFFEPPYGHGEMLFRGLLLRNLTICILSQYFCVPSQKNVLTFLLIHMSFFPKLLPVKVPMISWLSFTLGIGRNEFLNHSSNMRNVLLLLYTVMWFELTFPLNVSTLLVIGNRKQQTWPISMVE